MKLKVWWIPQISMSDRFEVVVDDEVRANLLLNVLAEYDLYQYKNKVKPDYCNTGGVEMWEDGEWVDWHNEEYDDFDDYRLQVIDRRKRQ